MSNSAELLKDKSRVDAARVELAKRVLASREFLAFIKYTSPWFEVSWHHRIIADALERVECGELKRLIIELPPRHSKSEMTSINFPAWVLGRDPDRNIIQASYAAELAYEFGRQARNLVDSQEYGKIFTTKLAEDSQAKSTWSTNGRGKYNALGVGGAATGKGADFLLIDDPLKNRKEADSFVIRDALYKWYQSTALTRLSPDGAVVIVATRWHDDDLIGRVLESETAEDWEVIRLPAIAECDEEFRKEGEALWSSRFNINRLLKIKQEVGSYEWSSLYQQNPLNQETQEFKKEMFHYIPYWKVTEKRTNCFITIDTAVKEKETSDYTGIVINFVDEDDNWHIKSERVRFNSAKLIDKIFALWKKYEPDVIGIEETTYVDAIYPFLKLAMVEKNIYPIIVGLKHHGTKKELRIRGLIPRYEATKIFHIEGETKSLEDEEMLRFPKGVHDDQLDALAYQEQIAHAPAKEISYMEQARMDMQLDERSGYLRA